MVDQFDCSVSLERAVLLLASLWCPVLFDCFSMLVVSANITGDVRVAIGEVWELGDIAEGEAAGPSSGTSCLPWSI